jgi:hypothetical protein
VSLSSLYFIVCNCSLFNGAFSNSNYIALNDWMISELERMQKRAIVFTFKAISGCLLRWGEINHGKSQDIRSPFQRLDPKALSLQPICRVSCTAQEIILVIVSEEKVREDMQGHSHPQFSAMISPASFHILPTLVQSNVSQILGRSLSEASSICLLYISNEPQQDVLNSK